MIKTEYIFIAVVYRNVEDIVEFLVSIQEHVLDYKVIIVNNYYDESTKSQFEKIATEFHCDFINCENKGYGAGNNAGIRLAIQKYDFDYLIVSNPDIVIKNFSKDVIRQYTDGVIGCKIYNLNHKNQNPMLVRNNVFATRMLYFGIRNKSMPKLIIGKGLNKLERIIGRILLGWKKLNHRRVYQIHGSFLIFTRSAINQIGAPYDEAMFLFGEEGYLAYLLDQKKIPTYYCNAVEVLHKEDGSMRFRNDINEECTKASTYFFEKYYFEKQV